MKLLHTADWHLGKKLGPYSRLEEQVLVMEEIIEIADREEVDAVLVAGDLYDQFSPSTDATELFYTTLKKLSKDGRRPVVVIAGNHDSPDRIQVSDPLARACGIILIGHPRTEVRPMDTGAGWKISRTAPGFFEIEWAENIPTLRIIHTPFANEYRMKAYLGIDNTDEQLRQILQNHWQSIADEYCDREGVNVLLTHLFIGERGSPPQEEPEGEKPIVIGNAQVIYTDNLPKGIDYVALGHLHRHQQIRHAEYPVIYSSSPLCYSFAEAGQTKYVVIIQSKPGLPVEIDSIPLEQGRMLARKRFIELDEAIAWLQANPDKLVEITLRSNEYLTSADKKRLNDAHNGIVTIIPEILSDDESDHQDRRKIRLDKSMVELFTDFFKDRYGQDPSDDLIELFKEIQGQKSA